MSRAHRILPLPALLLVAVVAVRQAPPSQPQPPAPAPGRDSVLLVLPGGAASGGGTDAAWLTPADAEALNDPTRCPAVRAVAPVVRARTQVVHNNKNWAPMYLYGTTPEFLDIRDWRNMDEGFCFDDNDNEGMRQVCVLGQTVKKELFGEDVSPINQEIRIHNRPFKVIGVLSPKGANRMGIDQDDIVLVPWKTLKFKVVGQSTTSVNQSASTNNLYPQTDTSSLYPAVSANQAANSLQVTKFINVDQVLVKARSAEEMPAALRQVTQTLRERHGLAAGTPDDFTVRELTGAKGR
jgi:hypothetical protein